MDLKHAYFIIIVTLLMTNWHKACVFNQNLKGLVRVSYWENTAHFNSGPSSSLLLCWICKVASCSTFPQRADKTPVEHFCFHLLSTATRAHNPCLHLHSMDIKLFFLGLCALFCIFRPLSAQSTCKLKAKFNLGGYKDVEKKTVVVGGMFPVHKRVASNKGNTSSVPLSSGCVGWVGHVYVFFHHRCYAGLVF